MRSKRNSDLILTKILITFWLPISVLDTRMICCLFEALLGEDDALSIGQRWHEVKLSIGMGCVPWPPGPSLPMSFHCRLHLLYNMSCHAMHRDSFVCQYLPCCKCSRRARKPAPLCLFSTPFCTGYPVCNSNNTNQSTQSPEFCL